VSLPASVTQAHPDTPRGITIRNPIIRGFAPDPSIVWHGGWYYVANSSFEWFPTIPIHRSRDLASWEYAGSFASREFLESLDGYGDSEGIWAPSLSVDSGVFWLTFCVVRASSRAHKDMDTYVSRAERVEGPWGAPARVTTTGFDPSVFHHQGRHWLANMSWDHRPDRRNPFAGITVQELSSDGATALGAPKVIHRRETLIEGPNLYFKDGYFYLMLAEGGTGANHGIAVMRSTSIEGPYEADPEPDLLTTRNRPDWPLQKAGHGELVQAPEGDWYLVHLASRWESEAGRPYSILGRETCLQRVKWTEDGWLRLASGGVLPHTEVEVPAPSVTTSNSGAHDRVEPNLSWPWNTLREPADEGWASLTVRPGWLRLRGRRSTDSLSQQSLVARRLQELDFAASVIMEAAPENPTQSAGLIVYYNTASYCYLKLTSRDDPASGVTVEGRTFVEVWCREASAELELMASEPIASPGPLRLAAERRNGLLQFSVSLAREDPMPLGPPLRTAHLSDDRGERLRFTGTMIGVSAQDLRDQSFTADFCGFELRQGATP
jgi:xylan 1,4-beta-xylosidase